jgi:hypothetical protein
MVQFILWSGDHAKYIAYSLEEMMTITSGSLKYYVVIC